jgi:hypothetical protein
MGLFIEGNTCPYLLKNFTPAKPLNSKTTIIFRVAKRGQARPVSIDLIVSAFGDCIEREQTDEKMPNVPGFRPFVTPF